LAKGCPESFSNCTTLAYEFDQKTASISAVMRLPSFSINFKKHQRLIRLLFYIGDFCGNPKGFSCKAVLNDIVYFIDEFGEFRRLGIWFLLGELN
jgi:hypothetical protein